MDEAARGYAQPASQVTDNTNDVFFDLASAKGNGFADLSLADLAVKDGKCSICLTWNVRGALSP
jgi:hypothetical protein